MREVGVAGYGLKVRPTQLRHLMNCVPDAVKTPELWESQTKLRVKYGLERPK